MISYTGCYCHTEGRVISYTGCYCHNEGRVIRSVDLQVTRAPFCRFAQVFLDCWYEDTHCLESSY